MIFKKVGIKKVQQVHPTPPANHNRNLLGWKIIPDYQGSHGAAGDREH
jgi:hypothetical protein